VGPVYYSDLNQLRRWIDSKPEVPVGDWYKDFGTFRICGKGSYPKTQKESNNPATIILDMRHMARYGSG